MHRRARSGMCTFIGRIFLLVLLTKSCCVNTSSAASSEERLDDVKKSNLHHVVGNMLGVDAGVVRRADRRSAVDMETMLVAGSSRSLPKYIQRLYERYRDGHVVHDADTVRSINAELGKVDSQITV